VQVLPNPVTREATEELMVAADLIVATGSQNNVREAYRSGTPAIGVGAGNVPVIVDSTADFASAATKIAASKTFDNATSCSSENLLVILADVYDAAMAALVDAGAHIASPAEAERVIDHLFPDGQMNRAVIAQDAANLIEVFELDTDDCRFIIVEEPEPSSDRPLTGENLSLVLSVHKAADFDDAVRLTRAVLDHQGIGRSVGIHRSNHAQTTRLAEELPVVRVLENQAHTFGNGDSFDNGLPFTLSMGCGTWAGNSISENLNISHFINITHLVTTIAEHKPSEEGLFGGHWARYGK
jgi:sulfoacetaldehyde dehydrogenase